MRATRRALFIALMLAAAQAGVEDTNVKSESDSEKLAVAY